MSPPDLVFYGTTHEYEKHYKRHYCQEKIFTADEIRIYFKPQRFGHVFWESSDFSGKKDVFCGERAQRIDWIRAALESPETEYYFGWDRKNKKTGRNRRVNLAYGDYIVVIEIKKIGKVLKGDFVTAYVGTGATISKIKGNGVWSKDGVE